MADPVNTVQTCQSIVPIVQASIQGLTFIAVTSGIYIAYRQLKLNRLQLNANHDWNRRSFTSAQIVAHAKELMAIRDELDVLTNSANEIIKSTNGKYINFTDRITQGTPLDPDEVHDWVCEKDSDGKPVPSKSGMNPPCKTSLKGEKIANYIVEFINIYELIGVAVKNGVYDEQIVIDTLKNPIRFNYKFYEKYIEHQIKDHGAVNFASSFKWMYEKFWNGKIEEKRKNTEEVEATA